MTSLLSSKASFDGRFAPILSRYEFIQAEKDGALHLILNSTLMYFSQREVVPNIAKMPVEDFKLLYLIIYEHIENQTLVNRHSFCMVDLPEQ